MVTLRKAPTLLQAGAEEGLPSVQCHHTCCRTPSFPPLWAAHGVGLGVGGRRNQSGGQSPPKDVGRKRWAT